ncbi:LOW QUALITY PROTEIN: protein LONGIFOLIA 1-like [Salvia miltiorrhiza]|uniref:LOW QUALITY PROTEIN: protein LONGIFOLIA 1-like n=1 Tax=Salvia miltiorrhiza TaxID=226208 RepID=UPI0025AD9936|nr:LOW QUALITY PROTEIN: protein LONGIFOLIA 1-like [Salvia miltiorrhiza]
MAAKLLHSLADDNLELQKQIGCMNGIYQLFDRHHILTSGRHTHKPLHQDQDYNPQREANHEHLRSQNFTEKIAVKNVQEKQRISNASPRASFSSLSRSSSSSSLDCIRASQIEFSSLDRTRESSSPQFSRHIRDLVKDSMYRKNSEIMNGVDTKQGIDDDVKVSVRAVEAPRHHTEGRRLVRSLSYHSRDDYPSLITRDAPRFSCDGREVKLDLSKSTLKLKDLPRLSLDGRPTSVQQDSGGKLQQSARPPSVVAKLMGLETLPHSIDNNSSVTKSYQDKDFIHKSRPFAEREANKLWKEPNSPRWRSPDSSMKPLSRFPLEPAPWKHTEGRRSSQKPRPKTTRGAAKAETAFPSVYSEIEKRLKDLEFTQSGKDLRALKQILEAMQSKKALQTQKQDHGEKQLRPKQEARSLDLRKPHAEEPTKRATVASRHAVSPIVIMKPASSKSSQRESAVTWSSNVKNDTTLKATQISTRSQNLMKDGNAGLGKSSGSISPRLIQKKLELEKRARPPTPPDTTKLRRQPSKQLGESNSPGGRRRPKHSNIQESGEKLGENENMVRSNASFPRTSPSREEAMLTDSITTLASNGVKSTEFGIVLIEHSSPVSVLDNRIHAEDSPSSLTYKVEKEKDSNMVRGSCADSSIPSWREYGFTSEMNQNKLQNIENLVEKLRRLNSNHDQAGTDYIASLCANTSDPDQRYISEILLASGVLLGSTPTDFQFHPSGHPINPELFLVLEQTKVSSVLKEACTTPDKRKLVFDTVNEILGRKLLPTGPWLRRLKQSRTAMNAQKLLRELCSEIEALQGSRSGEEDERWKGVVWGDVMHHESTCWTGFDDEISGAVLDIERSIFKDLVNEIVIGEAAAAASGLKIKPAGRRRPFAKQ